MFSPFLIYLYLHHILTIHFHLTPLLSWHLLPFTSEEDSGRNLLSYGLHCSGHFLINATNKTIVYHLMRMPQATPDQKLPYWPLASTLSKLQIPLRIPQSTMIHFFSSSGGHLPRSRGLQHSHINVATFQLHPQFSSQCCNPSPSSSVLKYPLEPNCILTLLMSGYHYGKNITPCNLHLDKGKITCDYGRVVVLSKILAYFTWVFKCEVI